MCHQPWMSVIYEGDTLSVMFQECSSMCHQPWMSVPGVFLYVPSALDECHLGR